MKQLMLILTLAISLVACSSTSSDDVVATSYKSMQTTATLAAAVLSAANDLHDQGVVSDASFIKVYEASRTFYDAYQASIDILYTYAENKDDTGKEKLVAYLDLLKQSVLMLVTVAEGLGVDLTGIDTSAVDTAEKTEEKTETVDEAA